MLLWCAVSIVVHLEHFFYWILWGKDAWLCVKASHVWCGDLVCSFLRALFLLLFLFKDAAARHRAVLLYSLPRRPCEIKLLAVCQHGFCSFEDSARSLLPLPRMQADYPEKKKEKKSLFYSLHCFIFLSSWHLQLVVAGKTYKHCTWC